MPRIAALVATSVVAAFSAAMPVTAISGGARVVLGKKNLLSYGVGWGKPHPKLIFNGGDPSGRAFKLVWSDWGAPVSKARGLTWIFKPRGGYYSKPGVIELQAYRLGQCTAGGPPAYTRLRARVAKKPGGPLTKWFAWGGWRTICRFPS